MQELISEIIIYLKGTLKYKWFAIILTWIIFLGGAVIVMLMPNKYASSVRVYVDTESVRQPLLEGLAIQADVADLVDVMKELMLTRPNLEKIVKLSSPDLDSKNESKIVPSIGELKNGIEISAGKSEDIYKISYESMDPNVAVNVVSAVLTVFSEKTQQSNIEEMGSSQRFIDEQISEYEVRLRNAEKERELFKRSNIGLLPDQQGGGQLSKLQATNDQLENAKLLLSESISKRNVLASQMQEIIDSGDEWKGSGIELKLTPEDLKIEQMRARKTELLLKYTEKHPELIAIDKTLASLLERKAEKLSKNATSITAGIMANPYVLQLKTVLNDAESEVASNRSRINVLKQRIKRLRNEFKNRLSIETELQNLNRDYETIHSNYQSLLLRREQVHISKKAEMESGTLQFKIVDPPKKPFTPSSPNRLQLLSVVLFLGIAVGFGLAFLYYFIQPAFFTVRQLRDVVRIPIIGSVSMQVSEDTGKNRSNLLFSSLAVGLLFVYAGFMGFELMRINKIDPLIFLHGIF